MDSEDFLFYPAMPISGGLFGAVPFQYGVYGYRRYHSYGCYGRALEIFRFRIFGFFISMFVYPIFANWVWGGGWLARLGVNFGLGHGYIDFAGSSVVHMVGWSGGPGWLYCA